ncbi:MAG: FeoB-associated Cys-rich membrane protein [Clostridia bacterium]|nr:FeoB-associated Cys-rich membrane protein [Clostridia bacterium]
MKPIDWIIIGLAVAVVVGVTVWRIIRKKQGKSGCDCCGNCNGCNGGCACDKKTEE